MSSPGNSYEERSSRTSSSTSWRSSSSSTWSCLLRNTTMFGTPTCFAKRMCSFVCGMGPSAPDTTNMAPSICAAPCRFSVSYSTVAVLMVMPRARSSGAASISSYFFGALLPRAARAIVSAAVRVVLPWSTWPMVPMFTWGFLRSNLPRAAWTVKGRRGVVVVGGVRRRTVEGWRKEEERGVSLWVLVGDRKGVELRDDEEEEEDDVWRNSMSLEEAVAEEIAMVGELGERGRRQQRRRGLC
ncbi:hypothetical protein CR513_56998, partial [Mucuna pruriens]